MDYVQNEQNVEIGEWFYTAGDDRIFPKGLLAGMNATASIIYDQRQNVLLVPNKALKTAGRERTVQVQGANGQPETKTVQVGLTDGAQTEILSGLSEGDTVIVAAGATTTTTRTGTGGAGLPGGGFTGGGGFAGGGGAVRIGG